MIDVQEESTADLTAYAGISIAFDVAQVFDAEFHLHPVERPYVKDYDALDGGPLGWSQRFDLSGWAVFVAFADGKRVGGAAVAPEDRVDLAALWDLRVSPAHRGRGVGSALLAAAELWAAARGCLRLKVETQNVNVPACRFYRRSGFHLDSIQRFAYPALPEEIQLLWHKTLTTLPGQS